jgi:galactokinase
MRGFAEVFGCAPEVAESAPGRINLLGEHTDYNDGFVLPTASSESTHVQAARRAGTRSVCYSANLDERVELEPELPGGFGRYVHGCIEVLRNAGAKLGAAALHVRSTVPIGKGLSSSAALEVGVLRALRALYRLALDDVQLARFAQQAEIQYAGVHCGIMDQMASSLCSPGRMLFLDTRTLDRHLLPLPGGSAVVVIDSGIARELRATSYNARREECERAARLLGVAALRDVPGAGLVRDLPAPLDRRARHVVTENARVLEAAQGVDARQFGRLMSESHASLRDDFEVSIPPIDALVTLLQQHPDVYGARIMGAGFGGSCVALARSGAVAAVQRDVVDAYAAQGFRGTALG